MKILDIEHLNLGRARLAQDTTLNMKSTYYI